MALVRKNFAQIDAQSGIASLIFYRNLFNLDPSLQPLFHTSIELQGRKLMEALEFTLATLDKPAELVPVLEAMGRRHVTYGTRDEHYTTMVEAMMRTLEEVLGPEFTSESETAWRIAFGFICDVMIRGADGVREWLPAGVTGGAAERN